MTNPRARLFELAAKSLPKILTLQDRNPHSPTYGCFDRKHWHLKVTDFPSGMAQEFVLPLALAYAHPFDGNRFHANPAIREWIRAGIAFAAASAHADGSCDDYFPFEKAAGAAAFTLYAMIEAVELADLDPAPFLPFLRRRGRWLARHKESGRLSNHEALIANGLFRLARLSGTAAFADAARSRIGRLLSWQNPDEGWFYEYQGADPGYLTLTIANIAEIEAAGDAPGLRAPLEKAVRFLHALQPPDGWLGGEWTSRNTNNYFPHGFEICGSWLPAALQINDRAVAALVDPPEYDDDAIIGHHTWSYLKAALAWRAARPAPSATQPGHWPVAGLVIRQAGAFTLLVATRKGGNFRLFHHDRLIHADTGPSLILRNGKKWHNLVAHLWSDENRVEVGDDALGVAGRMGRAKASRMTPGKLIVLRLLMLGPGRLNPDLVRRILQRLLITGAPRSALRFRRDFQLTETGLELRDRIEGPGDICEAGFGAGQSSIYTVMSRVWHAPQLQPWEDVTEALRPGDGLRLDMTRQIGPRE
ncbi:hypothetical protein [Actibacterium sp. D379-3]